MQTPAPNKTMMAKFNTGRKSCLHNNYQQHHLNEQQKYSNWEKELEQKLKNRAGFWELLDDIKQKEQQAHGVKQLPVEVVKLHEQDAKFSKELLKEKIDSFIFAINSYRKEGDRFDDDVGDAGAGEGSGGKAIGMHGIRAGGEGLVIFRI